VLRVYKPSTINNRAPGPTAPGGGAPVPYTLSVGSDRGAQAFSQPAGATSLGVSSITAGLISAEPILPLPSPTLNLQYLAGASAVSGTNFYYSTAVTQPVPSAYPTALTQTFNVPAGTWYSASQVKPLTVKVTSGGSPLNGAAVAVSGGPGASPGIYVSGVTSTSPINSTLSSGTIANPSGAGSSSGTISTGVSYTSGTITDHSWSNGDWYTSVSANCASQTAGNCNTKPAAGTITSASFSFGSALGGSSAYSVTLYKNGGAQSGASCNIAGGESGCTISSNVSVNGNDTIVLVVHRTSGSFTSYSGTGTATASTGSWSGGNWYTSVSASCTSQTAGSCNTTPAAGTITGATFSFASAIGSSSAYSVTLYKNGASTGSSCTIGNSQSSCTISGLSLAVNGTDTVVLVANRTSGTSYAGTATTSLATLGSWGASNSFVSLSASCASQTAGTCNTTPAAGTITSASFSFDSAIGATSSYSVTLYKNGASTGSACTIAGGQTGCTISGASVSVNGTSDTVVLVVTRTSGSGTSYSGTGSTTAGHSTPPVAGQITFNVPSGGGYTITAWGANTSSQLTGQSVTSATTKTLAVT
jgi:hypothetical protein